LSQALSLAESAGFLRTLVDAGAALRQLLLSLRDSTSIVSQDYLACLLAAIPVGSGGDTPEQSVLHEKVLDLSVPLSERELEVLRLIAAGLSNQQIAVQLTIEISTLKTHINRMYSKLWVSSRTQALVRARRLRLL
jgi:LuxR family transcriptional regulator, maltose regulon positive regulatory protein